MVLSLGSGYAVLTARLSQWRMTNLISDRIKTPEPIDTKLDTDDYARKSEDDALNHIWCKSVRGASGPIGV